MKALTLNESMQLLAENYIGRLGYISKERSQIVPITYYYDPDLKSILSYSGPGSKIDAMRKNSLVCFQVDEITNLENWKSVLMYGRFEEMERIDAKYMLHLFSQGVKRVIENKEKIFPDFIHNFSSKTNDLKTPIVYRIHIEEIKGRQRNSNSGD
ncbi:nitroimidazol reductase NimA-like FMN-containing flavoprotein (pyridoxamine 5'-phosphate oxidase superfamily) [Salegentibacter sp. 24]|uniref:pyridoxamine 5'-phosphate oxidase family protein n=1 Tax=Salegentibacter sp. 24 TaxID=2183986 RepID=UPI001060D3CA|nr:pyridoxamine 5'-phosphate oxidase family protein [Salegentibacter sp. 24]TDN86385.1 nitroimidazol reductase NimA-like FMN-containing flavoprotein (pyridoxamine 5'-phosphate oxidase superfamily) [Salegentibacter sp. 24]